MTDAPPAATPGAPPGATSGFRPDCAACAALCCIVPAFDKGPAFAIAKPAGVACPNLSGHACRIHARLFAEGFSGCARYDCLGAGQLATAAFGGAGWRDDPALAQPLADAFRLLREVQEMRAQLAAARRLAAGAAALLAEIDRLDARLSPGWTAQRLASFDLAPARSDFAALLAALRAHLGQSQGPGRTMPAPRTPDRSQGSHPS